MSDPTQAICCVATRDYLPGLILLYRSVLRHQRLPLYLLAVAVDPEETRALTVALQAQVPQAAAGFIHIVSDRDVYGDALVQMRFYYDAFELAIAAKAGIHAWMLAHTEVQRWLYLDTDIVCHGPLQPMFAQLDAHSLLLTPHVSQPCASPAEDLQYLAAGAYNGGVIGVKRSATASAFAEWYVRVLEHLCLNDLPLPAKDRVSQSGGLFVDQRWLDLVPAYFRDVAVATQRGFNLGHWNIGTDRLREQPGALYIADDPVTLLHLSGWMEDDPTRMSRYSAIDWSDSPVWQRLHADYRASLLPLRAAFQYTYPYAAYPDGSTVPKAHRRAYLKHLLAGGARVPDPFLHKGDFERACAQA